MLEGKQAGKGVLGCAPSCCQLCKCKARALLVFICPLHCRKFTMTVPYTIPEGWDAVIFQLVARLLKIARISFHQNTAAMFVRCKHGLDIVCC